MSKFNIDNTKPIVAADNPGLLKGIQGNILAGHGRKFGTHIFITFSQGKEAEVKAWIQKLATSSSTGVSVTSAFDQTQQSKIFRSGGDGGSVFVGFSLSTWGYNYLGFDTIKQPFDSAFIAGMKNRGPILGDPAASAWDKGFQGELHAVVILASDNQSNLDKAASQVQAGLSGIATIPVVEKGLVLREDFAGESGTVSTVINHFGYADGLSQPLFFERQIKAAGSTTEWNPFAPLKLVLSSDPNSNNEFAFGSLMAYRKLGMNPEGFNNDVTKGAEAVELGNTQADVELFGAYVVGRFKNGTPVINSDKPLPATKPAANNFVYHKTDFDGAKCPFHSHTRKTNPRFDTTVIPNDGSTISGELERSHRIARRAISFGEKGQKEDVGLLFICYQSALTSQFEFIQADWANTNGFVKQDVGQDTLIGQGKQVPKEGQNYPATYGEKTSLTRYDFGKWITMQGGEYFYTPSMDFLQNIAGNTTATTTTTTATASNPSTSTTTNQSAGGGGTAQKPKSLLHRLLGLFGLRK
ncbi:MAG: peroxidase [Bacteroidota bacterium]